MPCPIQSAPRRVTFAAALLALSLSPGVQADLHTTDELAALRAEVAALRAEIAALQAEREQRLSVLEARLEALTETASAAAPASVSRTGMATPSPSGASASTASSATSSSLPPSDTITKASLAAGSSLAQALNISGDLRLRAQGDWPAEARNRASMQLRGRLGAQLAVTEQLSLGARITTGDGNDPNSTDVQLSNWLDDLDVSLDMAWLQYETRALTLYGGKMPQPFVRTDLVWDGDVNPQGLGARYRKALPAGGSVLANGLFFVIDEQATGPDSTLLGAQLGYQSGPASDWQFGLYGAYYHYDLGSMAGADSGDWRSNRRDAEGRYLSRFRLANLLLDVRHHGFGERWPLRLGLDYVHNRGAIDNQNRGYSLDLALGRASQRGDWRLGYGYSMAQTDAVLTAFSHDNIGLGSNYRLHALSIDHVPLPRTLLSLYWYHHRPHRALDAAIAAHDWSDRLRLAFLVSF